MGTAPWTHRVDPCPHTGPGSSFPISGMSLASMIRRIGRRVDKDLSSILFIDQWVILTGWGLSYDTLNWPALRPLIPEKDRYCADPFVIERDDAYYVFVDEKIYATGLGRFVCLTPA